MDFDPNKDYYKILGVSESADEAEIKKAFRTAAVKHHPDRWGNKEKFQEMNEAFQVIWNKQKRQQYDAFRKGGFSWGFWWGGFWGGSQFGGFSWGGFDFGDIDLWDLVGSMFGWGGGFNWRGRSQQGNDLEKHITISFDESYTWAEKKIKYSRKVLEEGIESTTCEHCKWTGRSARQVKTPFGVMQTQTACEKCQGLGKIFKKDGKVLEAGPLIEKQEVIDVKIPAGIKDGVYLKYTEKGDFWPQWQAGDLYLKIRVEASDTYERKGDDLYVKIPVSLFDMVLGSDQKIDHPEGKIKVKIPKGLQIKDKIKISAKWFGKGWIFSKKGDMYVIPNVHIPKKLSKDQEKLWKKLQDTK